MALSKQIQLAHAQRRLRRLEEDAAAFGARLPDIPAHQRRPMQRWFEHIVKRQREAVRQLEITSADASDSRSRRSSAA